MSIAKNQEEKLILNLLVKSREALAASYCPYSRFPVGAALLSDDNTIYLGEFRVMGFLACYM